MRTVWERVIRGLGILTVAAFIVASLTPVPNLLARRLAVDAAPLQQADAIVVLGAGLMHGGILNEPSMRRLITGIELYKKGMAPTLVVSGTGRAEAPIPTEADVRAKLAEAMGIPPGCILKEETANTTREESLHIAQTLRDRRASRILLVTDSLHMRRAMDVFERTGLQVQPAVSTDYANSAVSPGDRLWLIMRVIQESAGLVYYRTAGYI